MPRSLSNAYWIEVGTIRERQRILALLEEWTNNDYGDFDQTLAFIRGDKNE